VREKTRRFGGEASGRNERGSKKRIRKAVFRRGGGEIFGSIVRSSVEGSLAVLAIFRCV